MRISLFRTDVTTTGDHPVPHFASSGVPGSSFFREPEHRYVRFHFAKRKETLRAAGEKLLQLRDIVASRRHG